MRDRGRRPCDAPHLGCSKIESHRSSDDGRRRKKASRFLSCFFFSFMAFLGPGLCPKQARPISVMVCWNAFPLNGKEHDPTIVPDRFKRPTSPGSVLLFAGAGGGGGPTSKERTKDQIDLIAGEYRVLLGRREAGGVAEEAGPLSICEPSWHPRPMHGCTTRSSLGRGGAREE